MPDAGYQMPDTRCLMPDAGFAPINVRWEQ